MINSGALYPLADIAEVHILRVDLLKVAACVLNITLSFISSGEFIPEALFLVLVKIVRFERALEPFQGEVRHRLLHKAMAQQIRT